MLKKISVFAVGFFFLNSCIVRGFNPTLSTTAALSSSPNDAYDILKQQKKRFANAHYRAFDHHNRTLFKLEDMIAANQIPQQQWTILHFDNHSDLYRNDVHLSGQKPDIGNYINTMIHKGYVNKVYWIIPDDKLSTNPHEIGTEDGCREIKTKRTFFFDRTSLEDIQFRDGPRDQLICVLSDGRFDFKAANQVCPVGSRVVPFYKRTMGDLLQDTPESLTELQRENFRKTESLAEELQREHVIVDVDLDYFDTSGQYANEYLHALKLNPQCYDTHFSKDVLFTEFRRFSTLITTKLNLNPEYVTTSRSPGYMIQNVPEILRFAKCLGSQVGLTKKSDPIEDSRIIQFSPVLSEQPCEL